VKQAKLDQHADRSDMFIDVNEDNLAHSFRSAMFSLIALDSRVSRSKVGASVRGH
jgi:hypothetical protein